MYFAQQVWVCGGGWEKRDSGLETESECDRESERERKRERESESERERKRESERERESVWNCTLKCSCETISR